MTWERVRGIVMAEGLTLSIPHADYFDKSPAHTPTQVLQSLDLLSVGGAFLPKGSPGGHSHVGRLSVGNTPMMQRYKTQTSQVTRRQSMISDVVYDHSIYDEFSQINLTIKELRPGNDRRKSDYGGYELPSNKRVIYTHNISNDNRIIIEKVLADDGEEDQIEIVDLDDDEEYRSTYQTPIKEDLYPNCDVNVWLRSCEHEIIEPVEGIVTGEIPSWINGSLLRNGPGSIKCGEMTFNHLFDAAALLHRFNIINGTVTYQCRFLQSETYKKNLAANRIVVSEFGTSCVPDPCQSIFERFVFAIDFLSSH